MGAPILTGFELLILPQGAGSLQRFDASTNTLQELAQSVADLKEV
jgi:hypothetical protein